jgi:hypothetical protein
MPTQCITPVSLHASPRPGPEAPPLKMKALSEMSMLFPAPWVVGLSQRDVWRCSMTENTENPIVEHPGCIRGRRDSVAGDAGDPIHRESRLESATTPIKR